MERTRRPTRSRTPPGVTRLMLTLVQTLFGSHEIVTPKRGRYASASLTNALVVARAVLL